MCKCKSRKNLKVPPVMSTGSECGHQTRTSGQKWCQRCAILKKVCARCGEPREDDKKAP